MSKKHNPLYNAINYALVAGVAGLGASTTALAQDQDQDQDQAQLDSLTITGSRIKRTDIEGASPVFVIEREEIEKTGLTSVGDLLQDLTIAGSALNTQVNNGNDGRSNLDLRNLGSNRLLVLMNGRRFVSSLGGVVDLNNIPVAVIKRIEVLKDGASSIYGSDAISGVVNIITRDDFEGFQVNAQIGQFESEGDGEIQSYDFSVGSTSDRGSVFFNASYVQNEAVFAGDRAISAEPQFGTGNAFGSSGTTRGRFIFLGGVISDNFENLTTDPGANVTGAGGLGAAAFRPGDFSAGAPGDGGDRFNFAPDNYLLTPQDRTNIFTQGTYDLTDDIRLQVEASYNNRRSNQLLAPTPLFLGLFGANLAGQVGVGADNPFNPFGVDLPASGFGVGRRLVEAGPRIFNQDVNSYRFSLGLQGSFQAFDRYFDWDVNYVYGQQRQTDRNEGRVNVQRIQQALSSDCINIAGCVPLNLFGGADLGPGGLNDVQNGTITQEMLDFILYTENEQFGNDIRNYTANVTGELFELPAGPLSFAAGFEYREESGFDSPDALVSAGITSGNARQPTSGGFSLDEFYVELAVPLLSGVTGAERLDLSLAARRSDYDTFGDTTNGKIGLEWQPIEDLLLRTTFSEGFRAPSIAELFSGQGDSFPTITDPCSDFNNTGATQDVINNCISQGVPADGSYSQPNAQIRITVGSNPNLQPETSDSVTFGILYSPSWLDGLDITIDWYNIELENTISAVGAQTILNACAQTLQLCNLIQRNTTTGFVTDILAAGANINSLEVEGVDFLVTYSFPETDWGFFRVAWDAAYQSTNNSITPDFGNPDPNAPPIFQEFVGFNFGDTGLPRWKSNADLTWSYGDWEASWAVQYVHGIDEACGVPEAFGFCNVDADGDGTFENRHIGGTTYHDVQASYHFADYDTRVTVGVDNLFDKNPPLSTQAFANSFSATDHRTPGRFPYVRVTVDF